MKIKELLKNFIKNEQESIGVNQEANNKLIEELSLEK